MHFAYSSKVITDYIITVLYQKIYVMIFEKPLWIELIISLTISVILITQVFQIKLRVIIRK
jgi:hypothetical protein